MSKPFENNTRSTTNCVNTNPTRVATMTTFTGEGMLELVFDGCLLKPGTFYGQA
jgi:hypothetical protein